MYLLFRRCINMKYIEIHPIHWTCKFRMYWQDLHVLCLYWGCIRCIRCILIVFGMYCASILGVLWIYVVPLPECASSSSLAASFPTNITPAYQALWAPDKFSVINLSEWVNVWYISIFCYLGACMKASQAVHLLRRTAWDMFLTSGARFSNFEVLKCISAIYKKRSGHVVHHAYFHSILAVQPGQCVPVQKPTRSKSKMVPKARWKCCVKLQTTPLLQTC